MRINIDMTTRPLTLSTENYKSGLTGFISWDRLCAVLNRVNDVSGDEKIVQLSITENGIEYVVERK